MSRNILLVTAGEHKPNSGKLNKKGKEQVKRARKVLLEHDLGSKAVILTSVVPRDVQTANIIAKKSGSVIVKSSQVYNSCKQDPSNGNILIDDAIEPLMRLTPDESPTDSTVAIVVGQELIKNALEQQIDPSETKVGPGQVWKYVPGKGLYPRPLETAF